MRLPDLKKILREDIKTKDSWILPMIDTLNSFMNIVYIAFNKNVTFDQNIRSITKELVVTTSASYPAQETIKFPNTMEVKASGLFVIQAYEKSNYMPVTGPVYAAWSEYNNVIEIAGITGLQASKTYVVRVLVI